MQPGVLMDAHTSTFVTAQKEYELILSLKSCSNIKFLLTASQNLSRSVLLVNWVEVTTNNPLVFSGSITASSTTRFLFLETAVDDSFPAPILALAVLAPATTSPPAANRWDADDSDADDDDDDDEDADTDMKETTTGKAMTLDVYGAAI
jgi:hypothetical protein